MTQQVLSISQTGDKVGILLNNRLLFEVYWKAADELALGIRRQMEANDVDLGEIKIGYGGSELSVRKELGALLVLGNGKLLFSLPMTYVREFWRGIKAKSRTAEEHEKASSIAMDQALLIRAGAPLPITSDPRIMDEAKKEATSNRDLRKAIPGIKSRETFGRTCVTMEEDGGEARLESMLAGMVPSQKKQLRERLKGLGSWPKNLIS